MSEKTGAESADHAARRLLEILSKRGWTLALAESCTGGLVSAAITAIPGASGCFWGSVVSYADAAKERILSVPHGTLEAYGAVSAQTVRAMAEGALLVSGADLAASISGIAGPDGGTPEKPVGTVWLGLANRNGGIKEMLLNLRGERNQIRKTAVIRVLNELCIFAGNDHAVLP